MVNIPYMDPMDISLPECTLIFNVMWFELSRTGEGGEVQIHPAFGSYPPFTRMQSWQRMGFFRDLHIFDAWEKGTKKYILPKNGGYFDGDEHPMGSKKFVFKRKSTITRFMVSDVIAVDYQHSHPWVVGWYIDPNLHPHLP